jgi:hypothetical protein
MRRPFSLSFLTCLDAAPLGADDWARRALAPAKKVVAKAQERRALANP